MRTLLIAATVGVLVVSLAGCGGSGTGSVSEQAAQHQADLYAIDQLERNFHRATSKHDIELMMSLWSPTATLTSDKTFTGTKQIRSFWLKAPVFQPDNHWVSDTPAYKIRITVNGDRGTLYFECHYVDSETGKLTAITGADQQVERINGRWLITEMVGASATLSP
jgi:hypothetical protein